MTTVCDFAGLLLVFSKLSSRESCFRDSPSCGDSIDKQLGKPDFKEYGLNVFLAGFMGGMPRNFVSL